MIAGTKQFTFEDIVPGDEQRRGPVNVASVPQLSPFRYPGGKTWFVPRFREWIRHQKRRPKTLVEPFVGGGIISLVAAAENLCEKVVMVELDPQVAAVWHTILSDDAAWLMRRIVEFDMTVDNAQRILESRPGETREVAFQTIVKNRTVHGGILAAGSGLLKHGESGKGVLSRWYAGTLARRIQHIQLFKHRITFLQEDAFDVMTRYQDRKTAMFFIDPPYSVAGSKAAGSRLYTFWKLDHDRLFAVSDRLKGQFLLTYDNAPEVLALADKFQFQAKTIAMKNTHHAEMNELVISKDLRWL
jgi:DNA adenine methylase